MNAPGAVLERARARLRSRALAPGGLLLAYVLLSLAALIVLSVGEAPFAVDIPNHATRLFIQCNPDDPLLSRMWAVEYGIIPNLAVDLINQPLCGLVDPMTVVRGSMVLSLAGILLLVWKIHRLLHGAPNAFVLLAPAMSFNIITVMGYVNYLIGAFLFLFFAWSVLRYRLLDRHPVLSIALPNLFGILLFFCHVFALALAGLFLFGVRLGAATERPLLHRAVRAGLWSAAGFAAPLLLMLLTERSGVGFHFSFIGKVRALWAPLLYASVPAAAMLVLLWTMLFIWAFREKHVRIHPAMRWPLVLLAAFSLLLPSGMLDAVDLDSRSLVATAFLAIAAIGPRRPGGPLGASAILASAVAVVTMVVQIGTAIPVISQYQKDVAEFRAATGVVEPLRAVLSIADPDPRPNAPPRQLYGHLASYATRDRRAFNPFEFTGSGMQPLRARPAYGCIDVPAGQPMSPRFAAMLLRHDSARLLAKQKYKSDRYAYRWDRKFDYVIHYHFGARLNPFPQLLQPVHEGSFFTILAVRKRSSLGRPPCGG